MPEVTFEKVLADLRQLSQADQQRLHALLAKELRRQEGFRTLEQIAEEQGVKPRSFAELLGPELDEDGDDDVDTFLEELYVWRRGQTARSLD